MAHRPAQRSLAANALLLLCLLCAIGLSLYWSLDLLGQDDEVISAARYQHPYAASDQCQSCHPQHHESWFRTYHRTMTAPALEGLLAPIEQHTQLSFGDIEISFEKQDDGLFVTLPFLDGQIKRLPVVYTIGSRRMQQFAVAVDQQIYRIPVFYNLADEQWQLINDAFFRKVDPGLASFNKGYALWNANCIFCHNTAPNPGMAYPKWAFASQVAEHGIACQECHGPGGLHGELNRNPLRRYWHQLFAAEDHAITHPAKLEARRSVEICGQCHGQRLPNPRERLKELMTQGDPYHPGADLSEYYTPLQAHVALDGSEHLRFWPDGSPRLTAYEYQGVLASRCFTESEDFTCNTCHNAHGGDPKGMIDEAMRGDQACLQCHEQFSDAQAFSQHAGHTPEQAGCQDCHMPPVVYGVMSMHPTHLIRNPDPSRTLKHNMPNACNLCHLDKGVNWAIIESNRLWQGRDDTGRPAYDIDEILRGFASGDAAYRVTLLDAATKRDFNQHQGLMKAGLEDDFGNVRHFTMRWMERHYRREFTDQRAAAAFIQEQNLSLAAAFEFLRAQRGPDQGFEFGE